MTAGLTIGAVLAVLCVAGVALPFLRELTPTSDLIDDLDPVEQRRVELAEVRDRALAALKELETDHRSGRIADGDYRALVGPLRQEAAAALRELDAVAEPGGRPTHDEDLEQ